MNTDTTTTTATLSPLDPDPLKIQTKAVICGQQVGMNWWAWSKKHPERKYRGRTGSEAFGKCAMAELVPAVIETAMFTEQGLRHLPLPNHDPKADETLNDERYTLTKHPGPIVL